MAAKRIVIVGGGFGGVYAARFLEKMLRPDEADICLVNRENYFVFQPLLPEVISGSIGLLDTVSPIRRLCPRTKLYVREIDGIDLAGRTVSLAPGMRPKGLDLRFDYLILAPGGITNFSGMAGLAEHALPFRTLGDALRLRNRVLEALGEADNEADLEFRRLLLTFVVAGGGFSGVEVLAELNDFARRATRDFKTLRPEEIRCVLVHSRDRILPEITPKLAAYAEKLLRKRGVELKLNARIRAATADAAILDDGASIPTRTLVSTVPSAAAPVLATLDCAKTKGRVAVNRRLEMEGFEGRVWALGDCAAVSMPDGSFAPPTAQHAVREARTAAENVRAALRGTPASEFNFAGLGKLGSLGHHSAVAEVLGMRFSGLPAWLLWRTIYWSKLPGWDRKLRLALDWATAFLFPDDLVQLQVRTSDNISSEHFEEGDLIFAEGDVGDRMYVITRGKVEVVRDGRPLAVLGPGDYFGEMAMLSDAPRNADVRALVGVDLLAVGKADFSKLLAHFPEMAAQINRLATTRETIE